MTFRIVTDSTSDLPTGWAQEHGVTVLGLTINLDGKTYETVGDNRLTSDFLLEKMEAGSQPTTSQVNVGQFEEVFQAAAKAEEAVLYLAFQQLFQGLIKVQSSPEIWFWISIQKQSLPLLIQGQRLSVRAT